MNYVEVNIGGRVRGLKFNQLALETYTKKISLNAELNLQTTTIYATFYAGLVGNAFAKSEEINFTYEDVMDWVDELYDAGSKTEIEKVCMIWAETNAYKTWLADFQDRIRSVMNTEPKTKKKIKSNSNGLKYTSSPSEF